MMWIFFAAGAALSAGASSVLAKCGIQKTDSNAAAAIRTSVVLVFSWLIVFLTESWTGIWNINGKTLLFLILSGIAAGASWLCYFHALQKGNINKVAAIDKSSTVLTILLALIFLGEGISLSKAACILFIGSGTMLMVSKEKTAHEKKTKREKKTKHEIKEDSREWFLYAALSAVFAGLSAISGKIGITGIDSNLGTALRTTVVLVMAWMTAALTGKLKELKTISQKEFMFIGLSGIATGISWLCYYRALQDGPASVVVSIDKLSMLVTIAFSRIVFHEKLSKKAAAGAALITAGTVWLAVL